ncbi:hypothetical protein O3M35_001429 [Rhynocoris fuscipes]|uniref:Uncharacterized protein n=1 Tax=Rhynocoris fuscipes TaxID=488301 RepID=A0AAW1CV03_9HEMI
MRTEAANNKNNNINCSKHYGHPPPIPQHRNNSDAAAKRSAFQRANSIGSAGSTSSSGPGRLRRLLSLGSSRVRHETAFVPCSSTPPPTSATSSPSNCSPVSSIGRPPSAPPSSSASSSMRSSPAGPQQSPGRRSTRSSSASSSPIYSRAESPIYGRTGSPHLHNNNVIPEEEWTGETGGSKGGRASSSTPDQSGKFYF